MDYRTQLQVNLITVIQFVLYLSVFKLQAVSDRTSYFLEILLRMIYLTKHITRTTPNNRMKSNEAHLLCRINSILIKSKAKDIISISNTLIPTPSPKFWHWITTEYQIRKGCLRTDVIWNRYLIQHRTWLD